MPIFADGCKGDTVYITEVAINNGIQTGVGVLYSSNKEWNNRQVTVTNFLPGNKITLEAGETYDRNLFRPAMEYTVINPFTEGKTDILTDVLELYMSRNTIQ